jgi:serine/threonine protein kinase
MSTLTSMVAEFDREHPHASTWHLAAGEDLVAGRRILTRLGGGDRYEAYVVWDDRLHAAVVAKVLRPHLVADARARAGIAREATALEVLQHPDLVRSFGADLDGPRPHLLLEFLDGPRLSTLVRRFGPLSPEQTVLFARRLGSVLAFFDAKGWVHLDVKPRNIVMTATPRLIDLSVARPVVEARGRTGVGTDAYMAPEQCDRSRADEIGPASDIWGLGATLYEAVTGTQAFRHRTGGPRHPQLTAPAPPLPERVPIPLADAIARCLADRPADRPSGAELYDLLEPMTDWAERSTRRVRGVR